MRFQLSVVLLAVIIVPPLMGLILLANFRMHEPSKRDAAQRYLPIVADAVMLYRQEFGEYPPNLTSLHMVVGQDAEPILMRPIARDPWGRDFRYEQLASGKADFRIWSLGPDGIDGTADDIEVREAGASR